MKIPSKEFALKLISVSDAEQLVLFQTNPDLVGISLAEELRLLCYEFWYSNPEKTHRVVSALRLLSQLLSAPEIKAITNWCEGIGEIVNGKMRLAIEHLDLSERLFLELNQPLAAAETQVSKLYALAMLGLYDKAIECALRVREVFLTHQDLQAAGKIELNLGNIYQKRDQYEKAEEFLRMAQKRFENTDEFSRLIQIDNSLANALAHQHKFVQAEKIYQTALKRAEDNNLQVLKAEIESNLGHLLLFQGRFDRALQFFESSRRRYAKMNMPHQSAIAEQELADAYLELNLAPEATKIYQNVTKTFDELELKSDKARALVYFARACIEIGDFSQAHKLINFAQEIYNEEKNAVGLGTIKLIEAKLCFNEKNYSETLELTKIAEPIFAKAGLRGQELQCRWLNGESLRILQKYASAQIILESALNESIKSFIPQITLRCYTSLGLLKKFAGSFAEAENYFKSSIAIIEEMRSPLPAEDFRMAFLGDKLTPYLELITLYLTQGGTEKIKEAFILAENARSRVLLELLHHSFSNLELSESRQDIQGSIRLETLRDEINWLYNQINRLTLNDEPFDVSKSNRLQEQIRVRENEILDITRKQKIFSSTDTFKQTEPINLGILQNELGAENALIEYIILEGKISAFVVTNQAINLVRDLCHESEIAENLNQINIQLERLRFQFGNNGNLGYESNVQTRQTLQTLYFKLIKPLEQFLNEQNLIIVPQKNLHYVPFQALFDGFCYLIEKCEISYSPSARIYLSCQDKKNPNLKNALFIGVNDQLTPQVTAEIESLSQIFPKAKILLNGEASRENLQRESRFADIVHFACHGKFRPDSPLFSALHLADGWFNVADADSLELKSCLVVLSACETGINSISVGDEILGLARGFFSAGATSLVLSFWQVDDETTAELMTSFYQKLNLGLSASTALRLSQIQIMQQKPHPFFWSPFFLIGCS